MKEDQPYVHWRENIPEFTVRAVVLGVALSIILGAANTYLGLYAGMTVSASIPAAVISMGILRGVFKRGSILENNMVQTMASTGESLAAGVIFTLPALIIAGVWTNFNFWIVTLVAMFGGILGIIFMIPMRKSLIVEEKMLKYPEGTACAEVLKAGEGQQVGLREITLGVLTGGFLKFFISGVALFRGTLEFAFRKAGAIFYFGSDISAALIAVGAIVGFNIGLLMFIGGALGWIVGIPILSFLEGVGPGSALDAAQELWSTRIRYIGVGAMIVAGIWSIIKIRKGIFSGFKEVFSAYKTSDQPEPIRTELNLSTLTIALVLLMTSIGIVLFAYIILESFGFALISLVLILVLSVFLVAVASYICGLVGSSNSPVSGMTICALLITALLFYTLGMKGSFAILATLLISGIICCATCTSGDISQDLKTGLLVGATPRRQQWAELLAAVISAFFFAPILALLHNAYGIGTSAPGSLKAPQAALFAGLSQAIFGDKTMPWAMVIIGICLAIVLVIGDEILARKQSPFRLYPMPVAVGIYLPLSLAVPILIGGMLEFLVKKTLRLRHIDPERGYSRVILLSSGLIAGEALMGIILALVIWVIGLAQWGLGLPIALPLPGPLIVFLTIMIMTGLIMLLFLKGLNTHQDENENT
ncbi:oligopeptide transporter, OPT family [bacterium]|nr:oligopeptide transporter, OPT family [bacterium]